MIRDYFYMIAYKFLQLGKQFDSRLSLLTTCGALLAKIMKERKHAFAPDTGSL